ncbi:MAG: DUF5652 family protein [Patescibacteria group bacterium]|nr:DUF5652 family protein [Patescibacteria group bacterium]
MMNNILGTPNGGLILLLVVVWEFIWKGIALWHSARNSQRNWFIAMLILNTLGILPIVYLRFFQKKQG